MISAAEAGGVTEIVKSMPLWLQLIYALMAPLGTALGAYLVKLLHDVRADQKPNGGSTSYDKLVENSVRVETLSGHMERLTQQFAERMDEQDKSLTMLADGHGEIKDQLGALGTKIEKIEDRTGLLERRHRDEPVTKESRHRAEGYT